MGLVLILINDTQCMSQASPCILGRPKISNKIMNLVLIKPVCPPEERKKSIRKYFGWNHRLFRLPPSPCLLDMLMISERRYGGGGLMRSKFEKKLTPRRSVGLTNAWTWTRCQILGRPTVFPCLSWEAPVVGSERTWNSCPVSACHNSLHYW